LDPPPETALKEVRNELDDLSEKGENVSGFRDEIDHALERIAAIEKYLGINKKIGRVEFSISTSPQHCNARNRACFGETSHPRF
jgi:hypothetical protein